MANESSGVSQFPSKSQIHMKDENVDHQNFLTSKAENENEETGSIGTFHAFPGWYADESWPGTAISLDVAIWRVHVAAELLYDLTSILIIFDFKFVVEII